MKRLAPRGLMVYTGSMSRRKLLNPEIKIRPDGWPEEIWSMGPGDFLHGTWARGPVPSEKGASRTDPRTHICGTRCCLVGWVRAQWGQPPTPYSQGWGLLTRPTQAQFEFLREFVDRCPGGLRVEIDYERAFEQVSCFFEGDGIRPPLDAETAARVWNETLTHFGYTP